MSTYLVAFVVAPDFKSNRDEKNNLTVWAQPLAVNLTNYALKVGYHALNYFTSLFNESYQIDKMDMVAVPDFSAGAMENWGLITYRENYLLYDETESSDSAQQKVASTIVHECAHMWFGNLVTPEWWGYLWLSEGFANYYQYFATSLVIIINYNYHDYVLVVNMIINIMISNDSLRLNPTGQCTNNIL
ncbi:hypothetical protein G9C98_001710 [Cotesia typhae]|uniref:Peptidase M1 membrane alanine aminopeptidase domain-containing protein n=1 Tax=Cotesia typhae TaxID=2053667 RepID=A0A8J5UTB4_9HYME|nr:hypothetical protein G9C98_001710 [Cotesia typhae]